LGPFSRESLGRAAVRVVAVRVDVEVVVVDRREAGGGREAVSSMVMVVMEGVMSWHAAVRFLIIADMPCLVPM
jgi:hypothetical protein